VLLALIIGAATGSAVVLMLVVFGALAFHLYLRATRP
jgi:hypothetical protein